MSERVTELEREVARLQADNDWLRAELARVVPRSGMVLQMDAEAAEAAVEQAETNDEWAARVSASFREGWHTDKFVCATCGCEAVTRSDGTLTHVLAYDADVHDEHEPVRPSTIKPEPVVYDIPHMVEYDTAFKLIVSYVQVEQSGDVDYGPHYWIEYAVTFSSTVTKATAAQVFGDYLAYNYQDNFRQTEALNSLPTSDGRVWMVRVHLAWGDRPYYTKVGA